MQDERFDYYTFNAELQIIGINPYVLLPENILSAVFKHAGRNKSPIPVSGSVNGKPYKQTLVKYQGAWRLYINLMMLDNSPKRIGEIIDVVLAYDPNPKEFTAHSALIRALEENLQAKNIFEGLTPSLRNEIIKYINNLKTEGSVHKNVDKAIAFLLGKGRFLGRDPLQNISTDGLSERCKSKVH
jgi:hypothetical protein